MIVTLSSIALPGTNGFVGEFLILLGAFRSSTCMASSLPSGWCWARSTCSGCSSGSCSARSHGREQEGEGHGREEVLILCCVVFFIILMGVYPKMFFKKMDTSVAGFLSFVKRENAYYLTMEGVPGRSVSRCGLSGTDAAANPARQAGRSLRSNDEHRAVAFRFRMDPPRDHRHRLRPSRPPCDAFRRKKTPSSGQRACSPSSEAPLPSF